MSASLFSPTHGSAQPCRERVTVRICVGRERAHRYIIGFNRPSTSNPVRKAFNWRTAIERAQTPAVLAVRRIISPGEGHRRLITNLCRAFEAAGGLSSFGTLIKPLQKSLSVIGVLSRPHVLSFAAVHANNKAWSSQHEVQKKSVPGA